VDEKRRTRNGRQAARPIFPIMFATVGVGVYVEGKAKERNKTQISGRTRVFYSRRVVRPANTRLVFVVSRSCRSRLVRN